MASTLKAMEPTRKALGMLSSGVRMTHSSRVYSMAGPAQASSVAATAHSAKACT